MRSPESITGYATVACVLLAAALPACTFRSTPAPGKIQCADSADCPSEVPMCRLGACYPFVSGGDASVAEVAEVADVADEGPGSPDAVADQPVAADSDGAPDAADWPVCTPPPVTNLGNGLIVYLHLDEGPPDPVLTDSSPSPQAVALRDIATQVAWTTGRFGRALALPGGTAGGYVSVGPSTKLSTVSAALTLSAWVRFPGGNASDGVVISRRAAGAGGYHYRLGIIGNRLQVRMQTSNGINANLVSNQPLPSTSSWVHLAMTYAVGVTDGLRLYVDGKPFGTETFQVPFGTETTPLLVGAAEAPNFDLPAKTIVERLTATVDEIAVFTRTLSPDEIQALACGQRPVN